MNEIRYRISTEIGIRDLLRIEARLQNNLFSVWSGTDMRNTLSSTEKKVQLIHTTAIDPNSMAAKK